MKRRASKKLSKAQSALSKLQVRLRVRFLPPPPNLFLRFLLLLLRFLLPFALAASAPPYFLYFLNSSHGL